MKVKVLPDILVNKIAAGEVIDRPAAIVRELVDNAVDAGATDIRVFLEQGGHTLIRVLDNGSGMERDDALLAFERHATSKIKDEDDLWNISTLGFRGEALPSIASVSKVTLRTKSSDAKAGTQIDIAGGITEKVQQVATAPGTDIEVRQLFFNTPARKKFLKQPRTEELRVKVWLRQAALAHPAVHFRLSVDGNEVLNFAPKLNSIERAKAIFKGASVSFTEKIQGVEITGMVTHPSLAQGETQAFALLVNGRLVSDRMLLRAVKDGFDATLKSHEFPVGFVSLQIPPSLVDVNVHPQKSEVRFLAPQSIFQLVRSVVRHAIVKFNLPVSRVELEPLAARVFENGGEVTPSIAHGGYGAAQTLSFNTGFSAVGSSRTPYSPTTQPFGTSDKVVQLSALRPEVSFRYQDLRFVGQVFSCYLIAEREDSLYVIDMHAAHERIQFNRIRNLVKREGQPVQQLLTPQLLELGEEQNECVLEYREELEEFGFKLGDKKGQLEILAVPSSLGNSDIIALFRDIAQSAQLGAFGSSLEDRLDHIAARIACHASVRSGRILERAEVYALFEALDQAELANACPHGRPVAVKYSAGEIEQWFGRDR